MPNSRPEMSDSMDLRRSFTVQIRCLMALVIREMMTRYGRNNLGFLWVILEPMLLTGAVMLLWSLIKSPYEHGVAIVTFVLTGYMPLTLWRHLTQSGVFAFRRSATLLYHRKLTLIDVFLARIILEILGTTAALTVVTVVLGTLGVVEPMRDPGACIAGWLLMAFLATGAALVIAVLTEYNEVAERFIQPMQYILIPISGCFYMVEWLPQGLRDVVWYLPMVHCYELFRNGWLDEGIRTHFTIWYPLVWGLTLTTIGLIGLEKVRDRIHYG
ncbi:MAG: ABC transporter permease [Pseudomonadota bacterium]